MRKAFGYFIFWLLLTIMMSGGVMLLLWVISFFSDLVEANYTGALAISSLASLVIVLTGDVEITFKNK
jgi:predicted metal-binding membrane protein